MALDSYIRVSRVKGRKGDSYTTVDEQRRKVAETAKAKGVQLGIEVVEEDVSGSKKAAERDLNFLLERVESGESEGIIVAYQDRLSRGDLMEQAIVWERLQKAGARFIAGDGIDSASPGSELLFTIKAALARDQWKRYRENWENTVRNAVVDRGVHPGGAKCLGYDRDPESKKLVVNPAEALLVVELFERRRDGMDFPDLARWLATEGIPYSGQAIRKLIKNPVYLGQARGAYGMVNDEAHEPVVSRLLFDQANAVKDSSPRRPRTGATTGRMLCQGLVVCESCGWTLQPSTKKRRKDGTLPLAYQCENVHCTAKARIMWDALDPYVNEWFREHYARLASIKVIQARTDPGRYNRALAALEAAEYDRDQFLANTKALALLGMEKWNATLERYIEVIDGARLDLEAVEDERPLPDVRVPLDELWGSWSILEQRDYLARFITRILVKPVHGRYGIPVEQRVRIETHGWRKLHALEYRLPRAA